MSTSVITDQMIDSSYRAGCGLPFVPNDMQREMYRRILSKDQFGCTILLKAPTGSGKTEAVVVPAIEDGRRLILIYPARSLLQDQEMRIAEMLKYRSLHPLTSRVGPARSYSLVVDTGAEMYRRVWQHGREFGQTGSADEQDGDRGPIESRERRHLLHGDVVLTTLDKFLYRFFGFGEERKGYIYPLRLRYGRRPLFCFDEAHSYEDIAFGNFVDLVRAIGFNSEAPRDLVVMTATMPKPYEYELTAMLDPLDFLSLGAPLPSRAFIWLTASNNYGGDHTKRAEFLEKVIEAVQAHHAGGRRTIVVLERVRDAIAVYERLVTQWPEVVLYHGRQPHRKRQEMYERLKPRGTDGKPQEASSYLLVTTSAVEVGCDLDAHKVITEICNPSQVIQRAGRCNRKGRWADARVVIIGNELLEDRRSLPKADTQRYLEALSGMHERGTFTPQVLLELGHRPQINDYRVRTMFTMLHEYVYEAERANKPLHDKGLVITRDWEPTVTLATAWEEGKLPEDALQIGIRSCVAFGAEKLTEGCQVYVRRYDDGEQRWIRSNPMFGGSAYKADIVIVVPRDGYYDPTLGYYNVPKVFVGTRPNGYERRVIYWQQQAGNLADDADDSDEKRVIWRYIDGLPRTDNEEAAPELGTADGPGDGSDEEEDECSE